MKKYLALLTAVVITFAAQAQAGTYSITPVVTGAFTPTGDPISPIPHPSDNYGSPIVFEVTLRMNVLSLAAGERGFANVGFNIVFVGDTSDDQDAGWQPDLRNGDSNGSANGGTVPLWATNVDAGTVGDEQGILVAIAGGLTGANDNRRNIGQAPGSQGAVTGTNPYPTGEMGFFYVAWDGQGGENGTPYPDYIEISGIKFQTASPIGVFIPSLFEPGPVHLVFGWVPEPSTMVMVCLGMIGLAFRRHKL